MPLRVDNAESLLLAAREPTDPLHHIRELRVRHRAISCFHIYPARLPREEIDWINRLGELLMPIISRLKPDSLRSFYWESQHCIPVQIFNAFGSLPFRQQIIETLRLQADSGCKVGSLKPMISNLKCLKQLSWKGLSRYNISSDTDDLRAIFKQSSNQLQELELVYTIDLVGRHASENISWREPSLVEAVLGLSDDDTEQLFSSLQRLSLTSIFLEPLHKEMVHALNLFQLRSLKIERCRSWGKLLRSAMQTGRKICLKSLEIQYVIAFIQSFYGLEELFISSYQSEAPWDVWRAAHHHRSTLKRFIHDQDSFGPAYWEYGIPSLSWSLEDRARLIDDPSQNYLAQLDLEYLGINCVPPILPDIIAPLSTKRSLQVLHIRQYGESTTRKAKKIMNDRPSTLEFKCLIYKLDEFAEWIFGPRGFPSLRILAAGDFSAHGR
ncbi:hypothetical protein FQN57_005791 [Myotisia sp. PD_48]|nr:hypothetical protein FQN57_005791 [Myotisia sp. PD_48]